SRLSALPISSLSPHDALPIYLVGLYEIGDWVGMPWLGSQAAAEHHFEAPDFSAVDGFDFGDKAQVVQIAQRVVLLGGGKRHLKLSAHLLTDRIPQKVAECSIRVWSHVKRLLGIDAGSFGCSNVSDGVSASFTQRHVVLFQLCPKLRRPVQADEVNLYILTSGDV